ncbi:hypothetical protein IFM89_005854 [Coptis chinensis]|uniref:Permuted single zf-CXXC unit domain-containing protein n=1 Tax=Coptis chinensis TaxID=261450 RepID=A0A835HNS9_9MAGN|nr:hypothetical protein IFM89_005854 [Coptis chinensis]
MSLSQEIARKKAAPNRVKTTIHYGTMWEADNTTFYAKAPVKAPTLPVKPPAKAPVKAPSPALVKAPAPSIKLLPPDVDDIFHGWLRRVQHFVEEGANCIPELGTAQEFVLHAVSDANVFHLNYMQKNMELQDGDVSKALVALTPEAASILTVKLKNVSQLRTELQVYELPGSHPLLKGMDKRVPGEVCSYLLDYKEAIPLDPIKQFSLISGGQLILYQPFATNSHKLSSETAESIQPPERCCGSQISGDLCSEKTCFSCNGIREANAQGLVSSKVLSPSINNQ